jgi:GT2 family glycosyltransferase
MLAGAVVVREALPGLSRARNLALTLCDETEVAAYVDDDAIVAPDWHEEMQAAWMRADPRVACIGGPIRPRIQGERPAWLGRNALGVLSMLDWGEQELDLDPRTHSVYGANMSVRTSVARAVGGFDETLGAGTPLSFGEDDDLQIKMTVAGNRISYAPGPWVWHVVPADRLQVRSMLRRRIRYGRYLGHRGRAAMAPAAAHGCMSVLHLVSHALQRDPELVVESAMEVAQSVGVVLGCAQVSLARRLPRQARATAVNGASTPF